MRWPRFSSHTSRSRACRRSCGASTSPRRAARATRSAFSADLAAALADLLTCCALYLLLGTLAAIVFGGVTSPLITLNFAHFTGGAFEGLTPPLVGARRQSMDHAAAAADHDGRVSHSSTASSLRTSWRCCRRNGWRAPGGGAAQRAALRAAVGAGHRRRAIVFGEHPVPLLPLRPLGLRYSLFVPAALQPVRRATPPSRAGAPPAATRRTRPSFRTPASSSRSPRSAAPPSSSPFSRTCAPGCEL